MGSFILELDHGLAIENFTFRPEHGQLQRSTLGLKSLCVGCWVK
jgi:hypothetical protein